MSAIKKIDRNVIKSLREEIKIALDAIGAKHGLTVTPGNAKYSDQEFNMNIEFRLSASAPKRETDYELYRQIYDLPELNAQFTTPGGETFAIVGCKPQARKNSLVIQNIVGKEFVCPPSYAKQFLAA
jgi:hypothetical protein